MIEFEEMLPGPDECWLESDAGHHTSELRVVALGARQRTGGASEVVEPWMPGAARL